ncbi:MAG: type II secretion system F family protein [Planctomycetaceae bacterium]
MWVPLLFATAMASSLTGLLYMLIMSRRDKSQQRLNSLANEPELDQELLTRLRHMMRTTLPSVGKPLMPDDGEERSQLAARLLQAGLYSPTAMPIFLGVKLLMIAGPILVSILLAFCGLLTMETALIAGSMLGVLGLIAPSFWLDKKKKHRQIQLRRALPDACDLIVICLSGGLSLIAAIGRVITEIEAPHPLLAAELKIVSREVQLGNRLADSLQKFGFRSDLAELQNLAAVVMTAEKYGSSMIRTLENFSETLRLKRQQQAEAMAQKAATKVLLPTLLFIFPAILLVILGPAMIGVAETFAQMRR